MEILQEKSTRPAATYLRAINDPAFIARQAQAIQDVAQGKGYQIVSELIDDVSTGMGCLEERPVLQMILTQAEQGAFDALIVHSLDRLSRRSSVLLEMIERLRAVGVRVIACEEKFDSLSPEGERLVSLFSYLLEWDKAEISHLAAQGRAARRSQDGDLGGALPFGYRRSFNATSGKTTGIVVVPEEAELVRLLFTLRKKEGWSLRKLARVMNGIQAKSGSERQWSHVAVKRVLDNEFKYRGGERNGSALRWPKIVEEDFFARD